MAIDYQEILKELRAEECRVQEELDTLRDALGALEIMASKMSPATPSRNGSMKQKQIYTMMGTKDAILYLLSTLDRPIKVADISRNLLSGGLHSRADDFSSTIYSSLTQLKATGLVERMKHGWILASSKEDINNIPITSQQEHHAG